ncbi:MAG: hypothetical protein ABIW30_03845, partial [Arenimonas sp.]
MTIPAGNSLRSLRGQSVSVLLALLGFLLLFFAAFWFGEQASQERAVALASAAVAEVTKADLVQRGERLATRFAGNVASPLAAGDSARIALIGRDFLQQPDVQYVIVFDRRGRIVDAGNDRSHLGQPRVDPLADAALIAGSLQMQWTDHLLDVAMPVQSAGERIGGVRVGLLASKPSAAQSRIFAPIGAHLAAAGRWHRWWSLAMLLVLAA